MIKTLIISAGLTASIASAMAVPLTLHNTGVDATDTRVASGAGTQFWQLTGQPGSAYTLGSTPFRYFNAAYSADPLTAAWVSPSASGSAGLLGAYSYALTFDLTGLDPASVSISGQFSTDNSGAISLNGGAPVATTGSGQFGSLHNFSFTSGFVAGLNTITVQVANEGDPTAFIVLFGESSAQPVTSGVPDSGASLALMALGLVPLGLMRKARR